CFVIWGDGAVETYASRDLLRVAHRSGPVSPSAVPEPVSKIFHEKRKRRSLDSTHQGWKRKLLSPLVLEVAIGLSITAPQGDDGSAVMDDGHVDDIGAATMSQCGLDQVGAVEVKARQ